MNVKHYASPPSCKISLLKRTGFFGGLFALGSLEVKVCLRLVGSEGTNPQPHHQLLSLFTTSQQEEENNSLKQLLCMVCSTFITVSFLGGESFVT